MAVDQIAPSAYIRNRCSGVVALKHEHRGAESRSAERLATRDTVTPNISIPLDKRRQIFAAVSRLCAEEVLDGEQFLQTIAEQVATITGDACIVRLLANDATALRTVASSHPDPLRREALQALGQATTPPTDPGFWQSVLAERHTIRLTAEPPEATAEVSSAEHCICGVIGAPLLSGGQLLGGIALVRYGVGPHYSAEDEDFFRDVADRAASTFDNARLRQQLRDEARRNGADTAPRVDAALVARARQGAALADFGRRALRAVEHEVLLHDAVGVIATTLDVEYAKVLELLPEGDALLLRFGIGWRAGTVGQTTIPSGTDSQAGYTLLRDEPVLVENLVTEQRFSGMPFLHEHGIASGMTVVIGGAARPYGILGAHTARIRRFTTDDAYFLQSVANILGDAIERARAGAQLHALNVELEARVAERTVRLTAAVGELQSEIAERQRAESVLRRYAMLLRSQYQLLDLAHDAIIVRDLDDTITFWNNGARALYGWQRAEALSQRTSVLLQTVSSPALHEAQAALVAVGWWEGELIHRTRDGVERTVLNRQVLQRDDTGTPAAILEINTDITERKREDDARAELAAIVENADEAIIGLTPTGAIRSWNAAATQLYGYVPGEIVGLSFTTLLPPGTDVGAAGLSVRGRIGAGGGDESTIHRRKDGSLVDVALSTAPVRDTAGRLIGDAVLVRDITARRRDEAERERLLRTAAVAEAHYRGLLESAPDAVVTVDHRGQIMLINSQTERLFGFDRDELLGRPIESLIPSRFHDVHPHHRAHYVADAHTRPMGAELELAARRKGGSEFPVEISLSPLDIDGEVLTIAIIRDVTERKRAEEQLRQTAGMLVAQTAELARSNAELEQFAYVASHDLQEPLRMVASYTQLLGRRYRGKLDADADEFIEYAVDGAQRMQRLIRDLLEYSHVETRGGAAALVDVGTIIDGVIADLGVALADSGGVIAHDDDLPTVVIDPSQARQLFQNLIDNALKYRRQDVPPRVHVSAERAGAYCRFTVTDNGIGIAPEYVERVFVIFQRLHTRAEYSGTGIGLAICKKIVERCGGRIWIEAPSAGGAAFSFTLPLPAKEA